VFNTKILEGKGTLFIANSKQRGGIFWGKKNSPKLLFQEIAYLCGLYLANV
jgi:hypothetical protein